MPVDLPDGGLAFSTAECSNTLLVIFHMAQREAGRQGGPMPGGSRVTLEALNRVARRRQVEAGARFAPMSHERPATTALCDIAGPSVHEIGTAEAARVLGVGQRHAPRKLDEAGIRPRVVGRTHLWPADAVAALARAA